jgi:5'-AMP-activated protein kinase regulatory beta subunit
MATAGKNRPRTRRVTFRVRADPGSTVFLAGDFNQWNPSAKPMRDAKGTGDYAVTLNLAPGAYEYKFVINGAWSVDPGCADWAPNNLGTLNSVRKVG